MVNFYLIFNYTMNDILKFKNKFKNKICVICGTGNTFLKYKKIEGAYHIGVNKYFNFRNDIYFDFYFIKDKDGFTIEEQNIIFNLKPKIAKFISYFDNKEIGQLPYFLDNYKKSKVPFIKYHNIEKNYEEAFELCDSKTNNWPLNLHEEKFGRTLTVVLKAFQFALYCNFSEIIIVGCDVDDGHGYFLGDWVYAKNFAKKYYPDIKIKVIRPKALKNYFEELENN